jgi:hypothetical protein
MPLHLVFILMNQINVLKRIIFRDVENDRNVDLCNPYSKENSKIFVSKYLINS